METFFDSEEARRMGYKVVKIWADDENQFTLTEKIIDGIDIAFKFNMTPTETPESLIWNVKIPRVMFNLVPNKIELNPTDVPYLYKVPESLVEQYSRFIVIEENVDYYFDKGRGLLSKTNDDNPDNDLEFGLKYYFFNRIYRYLLGRKHANITDPVVERSFGHLISGENMLKQAKKLVKNGLINNQTAWSMMVNGETSLTIGNIMLDEKLHELEFSEESYAEFYENDDDDNDDDNNTDDINKQPMKPQFTVEIFYFNLIEIINSF
ncbi:uncharacterized protein LOC113790165 [Dermatophagoides pteronyssinus]|uniref:Uncharacterized protein LOC113790165 n=1 Tax=Dermatophagoides pteronyssinus TaxID=6956 RepID=A0A6P6XQ69_DERPT|nr:uncharacterized protein LOC113790165 [Dermatophagoides pteronyssinus]